MTETNHTIHSYALFYNIGEDIIKLNELVSPLGYEFIEKTVSEFEIEFGKLIYLVPQENDYFIRLHETYTVSNQFIEQFKSVFGPIQPPAKLYFLKTKEPRRETIKDNKVECSINGEFEFIATQIEEILKIVCSEDIYLLTNFDMDENGFIRTRMGRFGFLVSSSLDTKSTLSEAQMKTIKSLFNSSSDNLALKTRLGNFNLAFDFYLESFFIQNHKMKFAILMTCLEAVFNQGKSQISHTISRHSAFIISKNKHEFEENYKKIKKLYDLRSKIIHGDNGVKLTNIKSDLNALKEVCQKVLLYLLKNKKTDRKKLFDELNGMGF